MKDIAYLIDNSWESVSTPKRKVTRYYKPRIRNQNPTVTIIKLLLVLVMGLAAIARFVYVLIESI